MKARKLTTNIAALALIVFAANVLAKPTPPATAPQNPQIQAQQKMLERIPGYAKLNDSQKADAVKVLQDFTKKSEPIQKELLAKIPLLDNALSQDKINEHQINKLVDDIGKLQNKLFKARIDMIVDLHKATGLALPKAPPPPVPAPKK